MSGEGMQVLDAFDLKRKGEDSILVQHQSELTCILWTALALGLVTIVIKSGRS